MDKVKVSIITVCYNAIDTIEETIKSVINQIYDNIEYIVIDGGSTDGTVDIIKKYSQDISYWKSEPDKGIYDAMNKGLKIASGDYVFFLNCGDLFFNEYVLNKITLNITDDSILYGNVMMHYINHANIYGGEFNIYRLTYENICHQSIFYPKSVYQTLEFDLNYKLLADWVSNMRMFRIFNYKYIPIVISHYFRGGASDSQIDLEFNKNFKKMIFKNLGTKAFLYYQIKRLKNTLAYYTTIYR